MTTPLGSELLVVGNSSIAFEQIKQMVEEVSDAVRLEYDAIVVTSRSSSKSAKGRYLVASRALKAGEVVLCEQPLFCGTSAGLHSREACTEAFWALASSDEELSEEDTVDDRLHPCSPLVDCVAAVLLAKQRLLESPFRQADDTALRLLQLSALCRAEVTDPLPEGCAAEILSTMRPELQAITSEREIFAIVHIICSNRFVGENSGMDVMFAGSMFEHSCAPNCFLSSLSGGLLRFSSQIGGSTRTLRTNRDVAQGEALSLDYLQLPDSYLPADARSKLLSRWGFTCNCPRCISLPEVVVSFRCAVCGEPELCPRSPGAHDFSCLSCRVSPSDAAHTETCLRIEARLRGDEVTEKAEESFSSSDAEFLGRFHHAAFILAWEYFRAGPEDVGLESYKEAAEVLVESVARLYGEDGHPQLLELYHTLAVLEQTNLPKQQRFLSCEAAVIKRLYPEVAKRQEFETMRLIHGPGVTEEEAIAAWVQGVVEKRQQNSTFASFSPHARTEVMPVLDGVDPCDLEGMD